MSTPDKRSGPDGNPSHPHQTPLTPTATLANGNAKDRWHQLQDAIKGSNLSTCDTVVFREVLDSANWDDATVPDEFAPTLQVIRKRTRISVSQIKYSLGHLERHGWIRVGKNGRRNTYALGFGADCRCTGRVHVSLVTDVSDPMGGVPTETRVPGTATTIGPTGGHEKGQPIGPTPHVNGRVVLGGTEREGVGRNHERKNGDISRCLCGISLWATEETVTAAAWRRHLAHITEFPRDVQAAIDGR